MNSTVKAILVLIFIAQMSVSTMNPERPPLIVGMLLDATHASAP